MAKASARRGRAKVNPATVEYGEDTAATPGGTLVIVESPTKAKTIGKYLGRGYRVRATVGHIMDLPEKKLGIDVDKGFLPELVPIPGKEKTIADLKIAAKGSKEVLIATDPDREGEAIAAHVEGQIRPKRGAGTLSIKRVLFHEITKDAVRRAIENAGTIDTKKVEAQQARRVLDRLVGYKASPVLWKTVKKGISAGRVQTVALRLIVEREREIRAFKPVEYWTIEALLEKDGQRFTAKLHHIGGQEGGDPHAGRGGEHPRGPGVADDLRRHRSQTARAAQESVGAVHHVHAAAGSGQEAVVRLQAHHARGAGSVRGHRRGRRRLGRPGHVHAHRLHARGGERGAAGARVPARALWRGVPERGAAAVRQRLQEEARRTRTKPFVRPTPRVARKTSSGI